MEEEYSAEFSYDLNEGFVRIPIHDRYGFKIAETVVDLEDLEKVRHHKWRLDISSRGSKYIRTYDRERQIHLNMTHIILNLLPNPDSPIDHRDNDGLNNRKSNLRSCTTAQNARNRGSWGDSSKYKGVCWSKRDKKWVAQIMVDYRLIYLGYFNEEKDAARAYNEAAEKYFGEFAYLNKV